MNIFTNNEISPIILIIILVWVLPWKIYALWQAVKHNNKGWFIAILILNTFAILEIVYVFFVLKKKWSEVKNSCLKTLKIKK